MIEYINDGISIACEAELVRYEYLDGGKNVRVRLDRQTTVLVKFWDFEIYGEDLTSLAKIKGAVHYFLQGYWRRKGPIQLEITLCRQLEDGTMCNLTVASRQKAGKHYLQFTINQHGKLKNAKYLDGPSVAELDVAISKAISLANPSACSYSPNI